MFSIGGIFILIAFVVWDAILGCDIITTNKTLAAQIDTGVVIGFGVIFVLFVVYELLYFVRIEFYKKKFQHDSFKEWKELTKKKKVFAKGKSKIIPKKSVPEPAVNNKVELEKAIEPAAKEAKLVTPAEVKVPILVNETPKENIKSDIVDTAEKKPAQTV